MDPFSIAAGAVGVADVCWRVVKYLKNLPAAIAEVQKEIDSLIDEIESLQTIVRSVESAFEGSFSKPSDETPLRAANLENLWGDFKKSLEGCQNVAKELERLVQEIYGKSGPKVTSKLDGLGKENRRRDKAASLHRVREKLSTEKDNLQILLTGISLYNHHVSQDTLVQMSKDLRSLDQNFKSQMMSLERRIQFSDESGTGPDLEDVNTLSRIKHFRNSIRSVAAAVSITTPNKFFDVPQPQNRDCLWGVFWIDASSQERIKQTYAEIGKLGEVEPNHKAAMHWLSNREERWLLIIDNADDPRIDLHEFFPKGDRGYIIITTRNPAHKLYGNVNPGFFEFQGMEDDDACTLLLRAARLSEPWDADCATWAAKITRQLGFLALALIHAGAAIRNRLCSLKDYLTFYDKNWERIRRTRRLSVDSDGEHEEYMSAHATYEVSFNGIAKKGTESAEDAIQLLKLFSFFYFKNIRFDILKKAVINCELERAEQERKSQQEAERPLTWYQKYKSTQFAILSYLMQDRSPPVLPSAIREGRDLWFFDEVRIRYALRELIQMSLVTQDESSDSYSMHPLVHRWARERPEMSTSEQAVWSQAAATTLAHSILLPPLGESEADEIFRRDILPHIDHVRSCLAAINDKITDNRKSRWYGLVQWPGAGSRFGRDKAILYAKFSIVFAQNGRWDDAESLQLAVKQYADSVLGLEHPVTQRITLALALTYWNQGRGDEAADLQDAVLQACMASLGPNSHETLMSMDLLGQGRWQQGRYSEARMLQQHAVEGLIKIRGPRHEDTLSVMGNLGRTLMKFYENLDEAKRLLGEAYDGLSELLGPTHLKSLVMKEELAMVMLQMEEEPSLAATMIEEVLECRKEKLGKEHPYSLLAMVNLARANIAMGQFEEAESLVRWGLEVADRNLGRKHIGTLMGRTVLGVILTLQFRFDEAEDTLLGVIENLRNFSSFRGDFHPDRLGAMIELAKCYKLQGRIGDSIRLCDETIEGLSRISLKEHPLEKKMKRLKLELIEMKNSDRKREAISN
ncbi:Tetratricopeptide repeat domain-containing [Trichophyton interdigitale]|uniref:Tetratricopeptide repeat domain-containing n=1 Tax=Trichophyton interdigitale TaxID=101480 RepID=A0A9P5CVP8_9EURO|nr:Tetratricopeptide repeat domain-containing [Trichophyton interdigitale]KAF3896583.1 Tetratricopeptide repeat domain-containing [Trichophyton interdigitale]KAG8208759.1 Tetratricopeptide repeat domain-containing [Trichophyton interdigitale]